MAGTRGTTTDGRDGRTDGERRLSREVQRLRASVSTKADVSRRMSRVRTRDTAPELVVRRVIATSGRRYRTRNRDLPGSPDLANRSKRWVVFVHGCFWHQHRGCRRATPPRSNAEFWRAKLQHNVVRDRRVERSLRSMGFTVVVVWGCEVRDPERLRRRLERALPS